MQLSTTAVVKLRTACGGGALPEMNNEPHQVTVVKPRFDVPLLLHYTEAQCFVSYTNTSIIKRHPFCCSKWRKRRRATTVQHNDAKQFGGAFRGHKRGLERERTQLIALYCDRRSIFIDTPSKHTFERKTVKRKQLSAANTLGL